jgi:hypothetical protein
VQFVHAHEKDYMVNNSPHPYWGGGKLSFGVTQSGLELAGNELQQGLLANAHGLPTGLLERGRYLECDCVIWKGSVVGE